MPIMPPLTVTIEPNPVRLPDYSEGITIINKGSITVNVSLDPNVKHNLLLVTPGGSLTLIGNQSYWATAAGFTTVNVLAGNQAYVSPASLQSQGLVGISGGVETTSVTVLPGNTASYPVVGASPNLQIWNWLMDSAAAGLGQLILTATGIAFDALTMYQLASNRISGLVVPNGGLSFNNLTTTTATSTLMVSAHP